LVPGTEYFRNVLRHDVLVSPKLVCLRVDASMFFANARGVEDRINAEVASRPELEHVLLQCSAVNDIDASALESLEAIASRLKDSGIALHFSEIKRPGDGQAQHHAFPQAFARPGVFNQLPSHSSLDARHHPGTLKP
jgi:SulP family sulfate permease